jgi:hypothetical protein
LVEGENESERAVLYMAMESRGEGKKQFGILYKIFAFFIYFFLFFYLVEFLNFCDVRQKGVVLMPLYGKYVCLWPYMGTPQRRGFFGGLRCPLPYSNQNA